MLLIKTYLPKIKLSLNMIKQMLPSLNYEFLGSQDDFKGH